MHRHPLRPSPPPVAVCLLPSPVPSPAQAASPVLPARSQPLRHLLFHRARGMRNWRLLRVVQPSVCLWRSSLPHPPPLHHQTLPPPSLSPHLDHPQCPPPPPSQPQQAPPPAACARGLASLLSCCAWWAQSHSAQWRQGTAHPPAACCWPRPGLNLDVRVKWLVVSLICKHRPQLATAGDQQSLRDLPMVGQRTTPALRHPDLGTPAPCPLVLKP